MKTHSIKCEIAYFEEALSKIKRFEVRINDREYEIGDYVDMREWNSLSREYTGRRIYLVIDYVLKVHEGITLGYCIFCYKIIAINSMYKSNYKS